MKNLSVGKHSVKRLILLTIWSVSIGMSGCFAFPAERAAKVTAGLETAQAEPNAVTAEAPALSVYHYFNDTLGQQSIDEVITLFQQKQPDLEVQRNPMDHEAFKVTIPALLAGSNPPDVFSYWAGARVQVAVDAGHLRPIDDIWAAHQLDQAFPQGITAGATYNEEKYFVPIGYHYVAFFYNKELFETVGASPPHTWSELKAIAAQFKQAGIPAFALGSRERWPAQFWFDYLLLRTAGPAYRADLMRGHNSYTDPEVIRVMELWQELVEAGYFYPDANAYDWAEAARTVARGQAAMTLMGTWITGYYKSTLQLKPEQDYDYFTFPTIDEAVPRAALGPIDGFVMAQHARHPEAALKFLTFLATPEPQAIWTLGQGALAPNVNVEPTLYDPLIQRVLQDVAAAETFAFNYDLATPPPMAEIGLTAFSEFMAQPEEYLHILQKTEADRLQVFK